MNNNYNNINHQCKISMCYDGQLNLSKQRAYILINKYEKYNWHCRIFFVINILLICYVLFANSVSGVFDYKRAHCIAKNL